MGKQLKLGVIGMSEGNGHPYSWSAIFNGFDDKAIASCPFPVIPNYLGKQKFPRDFLTNRATVTHIWTQDVKVSNHIASATLIPNICESLSEMISAVDAVLLARDDAENHYLYALPVLEAGLPIYIDKPFALSLVEANRLWDKAQYENQIFTCSALQFAKEYQPHKLKEAKIGDPKVIWGTIPKSWEKYAVHLIEPLLNLIPNRGKLTSVDSFPDKGNGSTSVQIEWATGINAFLHTTGNLPAPIWMRVLGTKGYRDFYFSDTFYAFKSSLERFIDVVEGEKPNISRKFTKEMVDILEKGTYA